MTFVEADAQRLPFPDDSFQIVSVAFGLRNVADTDRGPARDDPRLPAGRARGRAGVFAAATAAASGELYNWYFRHVLPRIGQAVSRSRFERLRLPAVQRRRVSQRRGARRANADRRPVRRDFHAAHVRRRDTVCGNEVGQLCCQSTIRREAIAMASRLVRSSKSFNVALRCE